MDELLGSPIFLGAVLAVLIGALIAVKLMRKTEKKVQEGFIPGLDELLKQGNYLQAGMLAQRNGKYEEAIEYFLRAQEPLRAAQVAARTNNARRAAELYERAGEPGKAADLYEQAGMHDKAEELRPPKKASDRPARAGQEAAPESSPGSSDPEAKFHQIAKTATDDLAGKAKVQEAGAEAAEQLLRMGEIRKAAEVYREAGLVDEAIHLYVNVLGSPGDAAPLVAARGNHERAAELYELAGKLERAAAIWVDLARASSQPLVFIDRIERLAPETAIQFLEEAVRTRPLGPETVEFHYRLAKAMEERDAVRAKAIYDDVQRAVPDYKDVRERLVTLKSRDVSPPAPERDRTGDKVRVASQHPERAPHVDPRTEPVTPPRADPNAATVATRKSPLPPQNDSAGTSPVLRPEYDLSADQVSVMARQAVRAALEEASRGRVLSALADAEKAGATARISSRRRPQIVVVGLEQAAVPVESLVDEKAMAARVGPSIETLNDFISGRPCDLQNIEVFYRLGLAYVAAGKWAEALNAFQAVEDASPGYRDAEKRAQHIQNWQQAVGPRMSLVTKGTMSSSSQGGRYRVQGELGRGGMAVVYRATDELLGREVALKFLAEELMSQKEMRDLFQREARSVAQLNHPNIITIYDFGMLEGKAFICMEFVEGSTVEHLIEQRGKLAVVDSLRITLQCLEALDYAHSRGIIHRDIKPSNMMRAKTGLLKLMDFGLAKSMASGTKASMIAGTPAYMPPEQFEGGAVDERADLFSVGCSLYEMLTGQLPFQGNDRSARPEELRRWDPNIPIAIEDIVRRALEPDPSARFQTARAFVAPLKRMVDAVDKFTSTGVSAALGASAPPAPRT